MEPTLTILTGAQTGVDTAAMEAAVRLQLPYEGWVPLGYTNEAGPIAAKYLAKLRETPSPDNAQRTEENMLGSGLVVTILRGPPKSARGGTKWALDVARKAGKRMCFVDLKGEWSAEVDKVRKFLTESKLDNMRCAINGPRESEEPGIEDEATRFLCEALVDSRTHDYARGV